MAGAGVPVSMDDGTGIAAAPEIVCPLPGVARSGEKWPRVFLRVFPRPELSNWGGSGMRCPTLTLLLASQLGMHDVVRALLEAGAPADDPRRVCAEGETAWCKASNGRGACSSRDRASAYSATLTVLEEAAAVETAAAAALATSWSKL